MCGEENPSNCHRRLLVSRVLAARGVKVLHIRGDGRLSTEDDIIREENGEQPKLFGFDETREWRSTHLVRQK